MDNSVGFEKAKETVWLAGKNLKKYFGNVATLRNKTDSPSDILTQLDLQTEEYIAKELNNFDPSIGFWGEEYGFRGNKDRFWLVDPIDGTAFFARGVIGCTCMLALVEEEKVVMSVIYDFVSNKLYSALKGGGAMINKRKIRVSDRPLRDSFVFLESRLDKESFEKHTALQGVSIVLGPYPGGYELALVASGKIEGRICLRPFGHEWDYAPGAFLVSEAGGKVSNIGKDNYDYRNLDLIAANSIVHDELTIGSKAVFPIT